ncbi:hypothetical protein IW261DRAFT_1577485 [Armillaria novae-zelandiae]|uniref:Uncharacterized protein n=1 Tax=Armillaria novae-zelandiae TaxID=153914 RepID=A0AA39TQS7_9AGAR|nr:hypothetical protein IW261DRAFT_1577485 [Armillaria novae-zelandiae]
MLPEDLTPSKIRGNPKLLLHNGAASTSNSPFNGRYGTILDGQDSIIVTPNSSFMPRPPIGAQCEVYMRANYQYGTDDHLQWPQAYIDQYPHFACIHRVVLEGNRALCPLFHGLTHYDFVECDDTAIVKGVGCLRPLTFLRLQSACQAVIDSVGGVNGSNTVLSGLQSHVSLIKLLLRRLHALPTSFARVCLTVAETQRVMCELHLFVEYMTIYKPLMEAPESDAPSMPIDDTLVGAFSNDATVVQRFFKVSIPVWHMVAMKDLLGIRIDNLSKFMTPLFVEEPCPLRLPTVFVGSLRDPQKYCRIQDFTTHSMRWVDPFALSTPITRGHEDIPVSMSMTASTHYSPYQKKSSGSHGKGMPHQFIDAKHPFLLPLVESWRLGLLAVVTDSSCCHSSAQPTSSNPTAIPRENQYAFPCPDIIATLNTEEKIDIGCANYGVTHHLWLQRAPYIFAMKKVMQTWNDVHPVLLDKVQSTGWTENEILELEKAVAAYYVDCFYLYFGHAPMLPHQLSHHTSEDYTPEARAHMLTSRSGVYMDVKDLI